MASVIDRPDAKSTHKPLTRQEIEELSTELHGTPLAEELKQIAGWLKDTEAGQKWMDLIIPTVEKWTDGETVTYHIISSAWRRRHHDWELKKSKSIYDADGNLIPDGRGVENMWEDLIQRLQQGIIPKVPADSDLAKYMAEHPDASVHRIGDTYTVFPQNLNGGIERFDLGGNRQENTTTARRETKSHRQSAAKSGRRPASNSKSDWPWPLTYEPADVSKIPADSDLGKILGEYPDAKVKICKYEGKQEYDVTWGTYPWGGPKFMGHFDMSGRQIRSYQFKSAAFKSGQAKVQDKKPKKEKAMSKILSSRQDHD